MKLLVVTNMYPDSRGNKGIFVKEQIDSLNKFHNIIVDVLNLDRPKSGFFSKYIYNIFPLAKKMFGYNPDIIHIHYGLSFFPVFFLIPIIKLKKIKLVVTFHGSDVLGSSRIVKLISKLAFYYSSKSIVVSDELSRALAANKKECLEKIIVIPCGIDADFFNSNDRNIVNDQKIIIFPSDPERLEKNFKYFLSAFEHISKHNDVTYKVLSNLSRTEVKKLYNAASLMLLTSDREGSPQVVKEAYASGLPVISRNVGDVEELSQYCEGVYVVNSIEEMIEKANEVLKMHDLRNCNNNHKFLNFYSNEVISGKIMELYKQC